MHSFAYFSILPLQVVKKVSRREVVHDKYRAKKQWMDLHLFKSFIFNVILQPGPSFYVGWVLYQPFYFITSTTALVAKGVSSPKIVVLCLSLMSLMNNYYSRMPKFNSVYNIICNFFKRSRQLQEIQQIAFYSTKNSLKVVQNCREKRRAAVPSDHR